MAYLYPWEHQFKQIGVVLFRRHFVDDGSPHQNLRELSLQGDLLQAPPGFVVAQQLHVCAEPVVAACFVFELNCKDVNNLNLDYSYEHGERLHAPVNAASSHHLLCHESYYVVYRLTCFLIERLSCFICCFIKIFLFIIFVLW